MYNAIQTNGLWGTIAVGLFASASRLEMAYGEINDSGIFMGGNGTLLGCQFICLLFVIGWVTIIMIPFFYLLNYLGWLRAAPVDEVEGLDSRYHKKERRPSAELIEAMSVYGQGNAQLKRNIHSHEQSQQQVQHNDASQFTSGSEFDQGNITCTRRGTCDTDSFEEHASVTPTRKLYEQRFTADSGGRIAN